MLAIIQHLMAKNKFKICTWPGYGWRTGFIVLHNGQNTKVMSCITRVKMHFTDMVPESHMFHNKLFHNTVSNLSSMHIHLKLYSLLWYICNKEWPAMVCFKCMYHSNELAFYDHTCIHTKHVYTKQSSVTFAHHKPFLTYTVMQSAEVVCLITLSVTNGIN